MLLVIWELRLLGFLLIPFYTNPQFLSTSEYGALAVLEATMQLMIGVFSLSMAASLSRWYWDDNFTKEQKSIFFTSISFLVLVLIPILAILINLSAQFSNIIFRSIDYTQILKLTFLTAGLQIINNLTLTLLRLQSRSVLNTIVQITKFVGFLFLVIWSLKYRQTGLYGIWQAYLFVEVFVLIVLMPVIVKNIQIKFQVNILKNLLSYGYPLMLASISGVLLLVTDRYMLNSMEGLEKTAIYSVGYRIANTLKILITTSLSLALLPLQMKKIGQEGSKRFFAKVLKYSSFLFSIALLGLSLFSIEVLKIITGSAIYWEAHEVVAIVSFALLFGQLKTNALIGITIKKRTKISGILIFITSILNISLNIILIPLLDIYGAALATLFSELFFFVSIYIASQRIYKIPYEIRNIIILVVLLLIFVMGGLLISDLSLGLRLSIKVFLLIAFPFSLALFNFYDDTEKDRIKKIYQTWNKPSKLKENLKRFLS